jgi:uncharacterized membrane protein YdjX (TVP38/TMEM64 family)
MRPDAKGKSVNRTILRIAAMVLVAVGILLAVVYRASIDPLAIQRAIAGNVFSPIAFIALQVVASLLFVPRTVLGIAAGLLFGFVFGMVLAITGAVAGAAAGFAFVRWMGGTRAADMSPAVARLIARAENGGWRSVAIVRLVPGLPHSVANSLLAMTRISWRDYLLGSFLGMLPMTAVQVDIGASGGHMMQGHDGWIVGCALLAIGLAASFLIKRATGSSQ